MTWGPWIEHTSASCPLSKGVAVEVVYRCGCHLCTTIDEVDLAHNNVDWQPTPCDLACNQCGDVRGIGEIMITHYRIRYPDALTTLRDIAANPERELADAQ